MAELRTVVFDIGDQTSLGKIGSEAIAKQLSSDKLDVMSILDCFHLDNEVCEMLAEDNKHRYGINNTALKEGFVRMEQKLRDYFTIWHEKMPNVISLSVTDKLIEQLREIFTNTKRKTASVNQAEDVVSEQTEANKN